MSVLAAREIQRLLQGRSSRFQLTQVAVRFRQPPEGVLRFSQRRRVRQVGNRDSRKASLERFLAQVEGFLVADGTRIALGKVHSGRIDSGPSDGRMLASCDDASGHTVKAVERAFPVYASVRVLGVGAIACTTRSPPQAVSAALGEHMCATESVVAHRDTSDCAVTRSGRVHRDLDTSRGRKHTPVLAARVARSVRVADGDAESDPPAGARPSVEQGDPKFRRIRTRDLKPQVRLVSLPPLPPPLMYCGPRRRGRDRRQRSACDRRPSLEISHRLADSQNVGREHCRKPRDGVTTPPHRRYAAARTERSHRQSRRWWSQLYLWRSLPQTTGSREQPRPW